MTESIYLAKWKSESSYNNRMKVISVHETEEGAVQALEKEVDDLDLPYSISIDRPSDTEILADVEGGGSRYFVEERPLEA